MASRVVYITFDKEEEAKSLAYSLLNQNLIACANIYPISSIYKWKGKVVDDKEFVLWAKTNSTLIDAVRKYVNDNHSYDIPCIVDFEIDTSSDYGAWIESQLNIKN